MKIILNRWRHRGEAEIAIILMLIGSVAWFTHVVVCLQGNRWGFLIAGALIFPIAIIHGIGIWFGAW